MSGMFVITVLSFMQDTYKEWFYRYRTKALLIKIFAYVYLALVCFCRLYLGRHSLDQIILGLEIGFLSANFS